MSSQILNGFGIDPGIEQVCDVGMSENMWGDVKIYVANNAVIISRMTAQCGSNHCFNLPPIHIPIIDSLLRGSDNDIFPKSLELRIRKWLTFAVCNHIVGFRICFGFYLFDNDCYSLGIYW